MIYIAFLLLCIGFVLLSFGADWLISAATNLAQRFNIPTLLVGMTLVAWGTSLPEMIVSVNASMQGLIGLSVGNVVGSNIANFLLIGGCCALLLPLEFKRHYLRRDGLFLVLLTLLFFIFFMSGQAQFWHGCIFIALVGIHSFLISYDEYKKQRQDARDGKRKQEQSKPKGMPLIKTVLLAFFGIVMLGLGSELLIRNAQILARAWGLSEAIIGVSLVALGTSLPELAASFAAARKREGQLIMGNLIGSSIYNIGAVMGLVALLAPGPIPLGLESLDLWLMLLSSLGLMLWFAFGLKLERRAGFFLLLIYSSFIFWLFWGNI